MSTLAFADVETLGLDLRRHPVWEIAVIRREPDGDHEHLWQIRPTWWQIRRADPKALQINGFRERFAVPSGAEAADMLAPGGPAPMPLRALRVQVCTVLTEATLVGSNPAFDAARLGRLLRAEPWHYQLRDIVPLAAGCLYGEARGPGGVRRPDPAAAEYAARLLGGRWRSRDLSRAMWVEPPGDDAHQALVDCRWARDVYDAVTDLGGGR